MIATDVQTRIAGIQSMISALQTGTVQASPSAATAAATTAGPVAAPAASFASQLAAATAAPPVVATDTSGDTTQYDALIQASAARNGVDPALLKGLIRAESNFDPNAGSPAGAQGLTQLMPGTAAGLGVTDVHDPPQAIEGGAKYLRAQLDAFGGDETKALAAYNAGPGAVTRYGGVPPYAETQQYVQRVLGYAAGYRSQTTTTPSII
jgi:soluble lytic murein transglycosylase-like protein